MSWTKTQTPLLCRTQKKADPRDHQLTFQSRASSNHTNSTVFGWTCNDHVWNIWSKYFQAKRAFSLFRRAQMLVHHETSELDILAYLSLPSSTFHTELQEMANPGNLWSTHFLRPRPLWMIRCRRYLYVMFVALFFFYQDQSFPINYAGEKDVTIAHSLSIVLLL